MNHQGQNLLLLSTSFVFFHQIIASPLTSSQSLGLLCPICGHICMCRKWPLIIRNASAFVQTITANGAEITDHTEAKLRKITGALPRPV